MVIKGTMKMQFRDRDVLVNPGEFIIGTPNCADLLPISMLFLMLFESFLCAFCRGGLVGSGQCRSLWSTALLCLTAKVRTATAFPGMTSTVA